jgi:hypothetical protein
MSNSNHPNRFFLFENGSVLGTFTYQERPSWKSSIIVEPSGHCFTSVKPIHNITNTELYDQQQHKETEQSLQSEDDLLMEKEFKRNTRRLPKIEERLCQSHHHLSQFCSNDFLSPVRQMLTFRNTYHTNPTHVLHQPTQAYLGACNILTMNAATMSFPTSLKNVHWPTQFSTKWCEVYGNDGAIKVKSIDGHCCLILAPHRQLFQLHYPAAVVERPMKSNAAEPDKVVVKDDSSNDDHGVDHGGVVQLVWTKKCPNELQKVLMVAYNTASKLIKTTTGKYMLVNDEEEKQQQEDMGGALTELLPISTCVGERLSWDSATVDLGGVNQIASESTLLCTSFDRLPHQQRVSVEWTSGATYWFHEDEGTVQERDQNSFIVGCLLHNSNTFMTCETTFNSSTKLVKIYRTNSLGKHIIVPASSHLPDLEEGKAVKHMLQCIAHCRLTRSQMKRGNLKHSMHKSSVSSSKVKETCKTENVGTFTMYEDGRLRGVFVDRTIVRIDCDWIKCELIRKDGIQVELICDNITSIADEQYVRALLEFGTWSKMTPSERYEKIEIEKEYTSRISSEADRIRRFLHLDKIEQYDVFGSNEEMSVGDGKSSIDSNPYLVPPVRSVLQQPVLSENPSIWITGDGSGSSQISQNVTPGRDVMERYIKDTIARNQNFLESADEV